MVCRKECIDSILLSSTPEEFACYDLMFASFKIMAGQPTPRQKYGLNKTLFRETNS